MPRTVAEAPGCSHRPAYLHRRDGYRTVVAPKREQDRAELIVSTLEDAFAPLDGGGSGRLPWQGPQDGLDLHAFDRGSACLLYADATGADDLFADDESSRIWVHGADLHVENFGTHLNSDGILVFDVNDFDEAYLGHFTWDLQRSPRRRPLSDGRRRCPRRTYAGSIGRYVRAFLSEVSMSTRTARTTTQTSPDTLPTPTVPIDAALVVARRMRRGLNCCRTHAA